MGGGMKDDLGLVLAKDSVDSSGVDNVSDERDQFGTDPAESQLVVDREESRLGPLDHHQRSRAEPHQLPAQFRADRPARTSHQNPTACDESLKFGRVEVDRRSAQQRADVARASGATRTRHPARQTHTNIIGQSGGRS